MENLKKDPEETRLQQLVRENKHLREEVLRLKEVLWDWGINCASK